MLQAPPDSISLPEIIKTGNERTLLAALRKLGRVSSEFEVEPLIPLLQHPSADIRLLAVKNIGKTKDATLLEIISKFTSTEENSLVRREAVSTIGRMRTQQAIPILIKFLGDPDAKIVLQAIRALLPFRSFAQVQDALNQLQDHPNELIQNAINTENSRTTARSRKGLKNSKHVSSHNFLKNLLVHGDVREVLRHVPDESIHLTFTSRDSPLNLA